MQTVTKKLLNYFLIGILAVIPIVVVLQIVLFVKSILMSMFGFVQGYSANYFYTALFFVFSFFLLVYIGREIFQKSRPIIISAFEHVIDRIPFLNTIYRVIKKVSAMFIKDDQTIAKEVVYVEYPKDGVWVPAYVTNRYESKVVLFIPTSPNPTSGFTVIVDKSKIVESDMDIEDATSFIVSVGVDYDKAKEMTRLP
ncbi:DUF502 domain-containing protein [Methyloglobulus sp.]|uniref:DUF502 domain-containing protein n=1 Tax=Methyloglobulus sp. TaxID=2518622 RepID=UPI0032B85630